MIKFNIMKVYNQLYKFACKSKQYTAGEVFFDAGDLVMVQPMLFLQKKNIKRHHRAFLENHHRGGAEAVRVGQDEKS